MVSTPRDNEDFRIHRAELGLSQHALALGYICMAFARLEFRADGLLGAVLGVSPEIQRIIVDASGQRLEARFDVIRKGALLIPKAPDRWTDALMMVLHEVKSEIVPLRNRLVHDEWIGDNEGVGQVDDRAIRHKPQSRESAILSPPTWISRPIPVLWDLYRRICSAADDLDLLSAWLAGDDQETRRLEPTRQALLARLPKSPSPPPRT